MDLVAKKFSGKKSQDHYWLAASQVKSLNKRKREREEKEAGLDYHETNAIVEFTAAHAHFRPFQV